MAGVPRRRPLAQFADVRPFRSTWRASSRSGRATRRVEPWRGRAIAGAFESRPLGAGVAPRRNIAVADNAPAMTALPQQFGNLEANLRFVDQTGVVRPGVRVLEIGSGTGAMLRALLDRGAVARGVELRQDLIDEAHRHFG